MSTSLLTIKTISSFAAGAFRDQFVVIDSEGNPVGKKAHMDIEAAQEELGGLKYFAEALAFARATAPAGATDKSLVGKANVVASYLIYKEAVEAGTFVQTNLGSEEDKALDSDIEEALQEAGDDTSF